MTEASTHPDASALQPGALDGAGLRLVVAVLSVGQITSWGVTMTGPITYMRIDPPDSTCGL